MSLGDIQLDVSNKRLKLYKTDRNKFTGNLNEYKWCESLELSKMEHFLFQIQLPNMLHCGSSSQILQNQSSYSLNFTEL